MKVTPSLTIPSSINSWLTELTELGLTPTFNTWAQITYVHMYLVTVRLRMFPQQHAHHWHQNLLDHYSYAAEDRMAALHNIAARSVRNKYLKDLFVQWRGVLAAYDEGLVKGDAVLATAVWRNVFRGDENVDAAAVASVVSYMKKNLRDLDRIHDSEIASGDISFSDPAREATLVDREAQAMKQPFTEPTPVAAQA
jgi:cytochrome b pre-mRNA-processing protein 3